MSTAYVIRVIAQVGPAVQPETHPNGKWIMRYDPEAFRGQGDAELTAKLKKAKRFPSKEAAITFIMQQPKARPVRADGKPNRPLLAFSLTIDPVEN